MSCRLPLLLLLAGCTQPADPAASQEPLVQQAGPRDLKVVVWPTYVEVYHPSDGDCWCATNWPGPDEGALAYIDSAECTCDPRGCIETIALLQDGSVVDLDPDPDSSFGEELLSWGRERLSFEEDDALELELRGCGEPARIPLPSPSLAAPITWELSAVGAVADGWWAWPITLRVDWDPPPEADGSIFLGGSWHDGWWQRSSELDPTFPYHPGFDEYLQPGLIGPTTTHHTDAGDITVVEAILADEIPLRDFACPLGNGRWKLVDPEDPYGRWPSPLHVRLEVDGSDASTVVPTRLELEEHGDELLLTLEGGTSIRAEEIRFAAGPEEDSLALLVEGTWWEATLPHAPLPFTWAGALDVETVLDLGDLTMGAAGAPNTTRDFTDIRLTWRPEDQRPLLRAETVEDAVCTE